MSDSRSTRRAFLGGAFALGCTALGASAARAQDPQMSAVQRIARDWLAKADALDGAASWKAAGAKFRNQISEERWTASLAGTRKQYGQATQRALLNTSFDKQPRGLPPGDYAKVNFRTAFANKTESYETVTLERESDGQWRVVGYFIR